MAQLHGLPQQASTERASDALWLVGLGEERFRPIGTMSTGQRQRVKLAQAIAHSPDLILLDEPTDGLDPVQRDDMLELIRRVGTEYGIDVVLSSHLLEEGERIADNVVIIAEGQVAAAGPIDELQTGRGGMIVVVTDRQAQLMDALQATGLDVRDDGSRLIVGADIGADELSDTVRDAVARVGAPLRRMSPMQNSLEDIFLAEVHGQ